MEAFYWIYLKNVLLKKVVGASILCRLNYKNEKTLGLLILKSILEKTAELEKDKQDKQLASDAVVVEQQIKEFSDAIFFAQNKFHVLCKNELECNQKLSALGLKHGFFVYDKNSFKQYAKLHGLRDVILIYGYENFWRVIADEI